MLPTWLGLRVPFTLDWLGGRVLGITLLALCLIAFVATVVRRRAHELLLVTAVVFPFLYASSTFAHYILEPRYLVLFAPIPVFLIARVAVKRDLTAALAIALALVVSLAGLAEMQHQDSYRPRLGGRAIPKDLTPLVRFLDHEHVTRVYANYWLAYRLSFETRERILATSTGFVRDQKADRLVRESPNAAYVFMSVQPRPLLEARGYRRIESDGYVLYMRPRV